MSNAFCTLQVVTMRCPSSTEPGASLRTLLTSFSSSLINPMSRNRNRIRYASGGGGDPRSRPELGPTNAESAGDRSGDSDP